MKSVIFLFCFISIFVSGFEDQAIVQSFDQITDRISDEEGSISEEYVQELIAQVKEKDVKSQVILGDYYFSLGKKETKNYKNAYKYFKKASKNGYGPAMYRFAYLHENGLGTKVNLDKTVEWLEASADKGYYLAQFDFGKYLLEQEYLERGEAYLNKAFLQNFYEAAKVLGELYSEGKKTSPILKKAIDWYEKCTYCQYQITYLRKKVNTYEKLTAKLKENPQYIEGINPNIDFEEITEIRTLHEELSAQEAVLGEDTKKMLQSEIVNRYLIKQYGKVSSNYDFLVDFQEDLYGYAFLKEAAEIGDYYQRVHKQIIKLIGFDSVEKVRHYHHKITRYSESLSADVQTKYLKHQFKKAKDSDDYANISRLLVEETWLENAKEEYLLKAEKAQLDLESFLSYQSIENYMEGMSERKSLYQENECHLIGNQLYGDFVEKLEEGFKVAYFLNSEQETKWFEPLNQTQEKTLEKAKAKEEAYCVYYIREKDKIGFINSKGTLVFYLGEKNENAVYEGGYQNTYNKEVPVKPIKHTSPEVVLNHQYSFGESPLIFTTQHLYNYNGYRLFLPNLEGVSFEKEFSRKYILAEKNGKKGIVNKRGEIVLSFEYEEIYLIENEQMIALKTEASYLYDKDGKILHSIPNAIVRPQLLFAGEANYLLSSQNQSYEIIPLKTGEKASFDKENHRLITFLVDGKKRGLFTFTDQGNTGLKSLEGTVLIEANYHKIYPINEEIVFCEYRMDAFPDSTTAKPQTGQLYDLSKKEFISDFHTISHVLNEEKIVCIDDFKKYYTLDVNNQSKYLGRTLIKEPLEDGNFLIQKDSGEGIVDSEGKEYLAAKFPRIYLEDNQLKDFNVFGLNLPKNEELKGLFDRKGNIILRPKFNNIYFYDGLIRVESFNKQSDLPDSLEFAYSDLKGKIVYQSNNFPTEVFRFLSQNQSEPPIYFTHLVANYLGEESNGIANGIGLLNVSKDYSGHYQEAQIPYTYEGSFEMGIKHGEGQEQYADRSNFEGTFEHGEYKIGVLDYGNQESYEGSFKGNLYHGYGKYTNNAINYSYEGEWKKGKKEGMGKESYKGSLWIEGKWTKGNYDGVMTFKFWDQSKTFIAFENGVPLQLAEFESQVAQKINQNQTLKDLFVGEAMYDYLSKTESTACLNETTVTVKVQERELSYLNLIGHSNIEISSEVESTGNQSVYQFQLISDECLQGIYYIDYNQESPLLNYSNKKEPFYINGKKESYSLLLNKEGMGVY